MTLPPKFLRIADHVRWHAERTPAAEAMVLGERRVDYAEFDSAVTAMARALVAAGINPGDRVAMLEAPTPEYLVAFVATAAVGAIWAGLNPRYQLNELMHIVVDSKPAMLLTRTVIAGRHYDAEIAALRRQAAIPLIVAIDGGDGDDMIAFADFIAAGAGVDDAALAARMAIAGGRQACLLVYTSGSTGKPKGALLHQQGIVDFAHAQNRIWPLSPLRMLNYFPVNHVGATVDLATPCLVAGGTTVFMEKFEADAALDIMERERINFWGAPPAAFISQLDALRRRPRDLSAVQLIVWEGAPIAVETFDALSAICPVMATNYGMTESTSAIACVAPITDREALLNSVGPPFPGVEIRLADTAGQAVADGEIGEVLARSDYCFLGYLNQPEASAAAFSDDGFLRTGDLAMKRPDGTYRIVGRCKEMYKSGGYNVYPREVEAVLESHPAVVEAVVVAVDDPQWQEVGVAFVTLSTATSADEILAFTRENLANYKIPKRLVIELVMPLLPIGKIDRQALRRKAEAG